MVAVNSFNVPRTTYSTTPSVLSARSFRSCSSKCPPSAFLSDAPKEPKTTEGPKRAKFRQRAKPFSCGVASNIFNVFTFGVSLLLFVSSFVKLQNDSDADLFDISGLMPSFFYATVLSNGLAWFALIGFFVHILSVGMMKTRRTLPDLVAASLWLVLSCLKLKPVTKDIIVYQLGFSAILSVVAFAVTFFPRKRLHRKKPNSIIQSAFSVASTPISQCSTMTAHSTPNRLSAAKPNADAMDEDDEEMTWIQRRMRHASPSRELSSMLGGLSLGKAPSEQPEEVRRAGPFGSMRHPILAPSRLGSTTESFRPDSAFSAHYAASTVPSIMTSISQSLAQPSFSLVNVICFSALSASLCLNFFMLYYIFYVKCN